MWSETGLSVRVPKDFMQMLVQMCLGCLFFILMCVQTCFGFGRNFVFRCCRFTSIVCCFFSFCSFQMMQCICGVGFDKFERVLAHVMVAYVCVFSIVSVGVSLFNRDIAVQAFYLSQTCGTMRCECAPDNQRKTKVGLYSVIGLPLGATRWIAMAAMKSSSTRI